MTQTHEALEELERRVAAHLEAIYPGNDNAALTQQLIARLELDNPVTPRPHENKWNQGDILVITYGNSIVRNDERPLLTLRNFLENRLTGAITGVHILPFFPYSSDDGFAVINYLQVNNALGDWTDIETIGRQFKLMADLVINHASSRSQWFENFKHGVDPGRTISLRWSQEPMSLKLCGHAPRRCSSPPKPRKVSDWSGARLDQTRLI